MRVGARPVDPTTTYQRFDQDNGRVKDDWSFDVQNVFGLNRISVTPLPAGWVIRSIDHQGRDLADMPLDVRGGQRIDGITIVLSKSLPRVQGTLTDDRGQPIDASVLMFPEDTSKWGEDSRLVRSARPDPGGAFEFRNVIPGSYLIVPLEYVRDGAWRDPAFLEALRDQSTRVHVADAGATGVALTLKKAS